MSPRTKEQFDEIREKSRMKILEAALELFSQRGYHGTSVSMIAKHAGVSAGLMYNYFSSKLDLLEAIVKYGVELIGETMVGLEEIEDPRQKFVALIDTTFRVALEDMHFWSLYFEVMMQPDLPENVMQIFKGFMIEMFKGIEALFTEMNIPDPKTEAKIFGAILDGVLLHYIIMKDEYPLTEVKNAITRKYTDIGKNN